MSIALDLDYVSPNQIRVFLQELKDCLLLKNGFGTDTCEIYVYTLMEHSPLFALDPKNIECDESLQRVHRIVRHLCTEFAGHNDCIVGILGAPCNVSETHRMHIQVRRK